MLETGVSLATHGTVYVDTLQWLQEIVNIGQVGAGGHLYSKYFPGNALGAALIYRIAAVANDRPYVWQSAVLGRHELATSEAGVRLALRLNALLGALGLAILFAWVMRRFGLHTAAATAIIIGLGSDWWYQSRGFFSEVGAGTGLIAALYLADAEQIWSASASLGVSLLFRPTNLIATPIWLYALRNKERRGLISGLCIVVSLALLGYYNWVRFGSFADFGYGPESFKSTVLLGLVGVLLSPGRSMLLYSPPLLLAFAGARWTYVKERGFALLTIGVVSGYVLMAAAWQDWWGGKVWGSRLVTPIIPLVGVLVAPVLDRALRSCNSRLKFPFLLLGLLGLAIQMLTITQDPVTVLDSYLKSGYATYAQSIVSLNKSALALQVLNLPNIGPCTLDAQTLRMLFQQCR